MKEEFADGWNYARYSTGFTIGKVVFNPVLSEPSRADHIPWLNFEPAMLLRWKRRTFFPVALKLLRELESITRRPHAQPEVHQMFLGGDWGVCAVNLRHSVLGRNLTWGKTVPRAGVLNDAASGGDWAAPSQQP